MDAQALLEPRGENPPSGEDMEYEPVFIELSMDADPAPVIPAPGQEPVPVDPDFSSVRTKAMEVLQASHDLRAAVYLADALLNQKGLPGLAQVTAYMRGCIETYWDTCHPMLDEDDGDVTMRTSALQGLSGQPETISGPSRVFTSLRNCGLTQSQTFGRVSLRDIEVAEGAAPTPEKGEQLSLGAVSAAFQDTDPEVLSANLAAVRQVREDVRAILAVFDDKAPGEGPEFSDLIKLLNNIEKRLVEHAGETADEDLSLEEDEELEPEDEDAAGAGAAPRAAKPPPGTINSSADVAAALDRIIAYYQRSEPSSPIPIILKRAKRLVGASFLEIIQDMAPMGMDSVQTIGGPDDDA